MSLAMTEFHRGLTTIAEAPSLTELLDGLHAAVRAVGAEGTSLGIVQGEEVRQSARGFDPGVAEEWASFPLRTALPGPEAVRTGTPQFLPDKGSTLQRFPTAEAIIADSSYAAGACLPLTRDRRAFGYLAVHYTGAHTFDAAEQFLLLTLAAVAAGSGWRLTFQSDRAGEGWAAEEEAVALREEMHGLTTAMANRAVIEQAKGMLMQRYAVSAEGAWELLVRMSSLTHTKVRDLAQQCVARGEVEGLGEDVDPRSSP